MNKFLRMIEQAALLVVFALVGVGTALAATPSSSMQLVDSRVNHKDLTLSYNVSGDGGTVAQVDLYLKKDDAPWQKVLTSYDTSAPFKLNVDDYGGDGTYAFYTVATLASGEIEADKGRAEVVTVVDTVTPPGVDGSHLYINKSAADLTTNEISGHSLAAEAYSVVNIYSNSSLTAWVASAGVNENGSFGPVQVGNRYPTLWLTVTDRNGNRSVAVAVTNQVSFAAKVNNLIAASYTGDMLDLSFDGAANAVSYVVYYRHAGGSEWSAMMMTESTTPKLTGLEAGRSYDIRVAPMDASGNVGMYSFITTRTAGTRVDSVPLTNVAVGGDTLSPVVVAKATTVAPVAVGGTSTTVSAPTTTGTVGSTTDTGEATVEVEGESGSSAAVSNGETPAVEGEAPAVEGETPATEEGAGETIDGEAAPAEEAAATEDEGSSATPWVILAILIILAGIATGGYFYWFSGPEEVTTTVKPDDKDEEDKRW